MAELSNKTREMVVDLVCGVGRVALVAFVLLGLGALVYTYANLYYETWLSCPDGVVVRDAAGLPACARGVAVGVGR